MKKIKSGTLEQEDIYNLKDVIEKLNKMVWLEVVLEKEGIKDMIENTNKFLVKHAR